MHFKSSSEKVDRTRSHRIRMSIVEDDESVRQALERLLISAGYETESFDSAEGFLAANRDDQSGCLILDVQLPGMSGMDLHTELLLTSSKPVPVVMITARVDEATRQQAVEAGVAAFLRKPFHTKQLLDAVKKALTSTT